ncbi:MAG TPA: hypothetical protein VFZ61_34290, partial [Polyangiales bacterium]
MGSSEVSPGPHRRQRRPGIVWGAALVGLFGLGAAPAIADPPAVARQGSHAHATHESIALKAASLEAAASVALNDSPDVAAAPFSSLNLEDPSGHA